MSVEYQHSILWRGEDPVNKKFVPKLDTSKKVVRYFPGKEPRWAEKAKADKEKDDGEVVKQKARDRRRARAQAAVIVEDAASSRLKRLQESASSSSAVAERLLRHRIVHDAQVLENQESLKKDDDDDDEEPKEEASTKVDAELKEEGLDLERKHPVIDGVVELGPGTAEEEEEIIAFRRERARELALLKRKEEENLLQTKVEEDEDAEEDEDEEESEEETDSDDDDPRRRANFKPVFISKAQRETIKEKEALERQEEEAEERSKEKLRERKAESKGLLIDKIKADDEAERAGVNENDKSDIELLDDDDEKNEAEEYENWKIRELKRIKRDKEERLERQRELDFIERRRAMTDEERAADDARLDAQAVQREEVKKFNFMQKYYHRGGFFQDKARTGEEPLYLRDYHEPLEEEKFDKNLLPKAMQLRRGEFGKKGQVKHSHLTDVDTTDMSAAWSQHTKQIQRYQERMASAKGVNHFDRPTASSARGPKLP